MSRTCSAEIPAFVSHTVPLPRCCPVSGNPAPGSMLRVSYLPNGVVLPVEDLTAWVREFVDGHPSGIREMEAMIQDLARQTAEVVGVPVRAVADLKIDPPIPGDQQTMRVSARATPAEANPLPKEHDMNPFKPDGEYETILFDTLRMAFLSGESWQRRNSLSDEMAAEYRDKAAYDCADGASTGLRLIRSTPVEAERVVTAPDIDAFAAQHARHVPRLQGAGISVDLAATLFAAAIRGWQEACGGGTVKVEPVAWRVLINQNGRTMNVYTEFLPFTPLVGEGITVKREPEPLYLCPPLACLQPRPEKAERDNETLRAGATEAMIEAGLKVDMDGEDERAVLHNIWNAMQSAALASDPVRLEALPAIVRKDAEVERKAARELAQHVMQMTFISGAGHLAKKLAMSVLGITDPFGRTEDEVCIVTNGTTRFLPRNEPVFLLRGQDVASGDAVRAWADLAEALGAAPDIIKTARAHADKMDAWRPKKTPDLCAGDPNDRAALAEKQP